MFCPETWSISSWNAVRFSMVRFLWVSVMQNSLHWLDKSSKSCWKCNLIRKWNPGIDNKRNWHSGNGPQCLNWENLVPDVSYWQSYYGTLFRELGVFFYWPQIKMLTLKPGRVAQLVGHLTRKSGVLGLIPGLATYFRFSFRFFKKGSCQLLAKVCARSTG